jgi:TrpR-related protein YerC/YecD
MNKLKCESVDDFFDAVLTLKNREECYKFFSDVCTAKGVKAVAQRFTVAEMLRDKKVYTEIVAKTGASTATISRVNRSLEESNNGYDIVFERLEK